MKIKKISKKFNETNITEEELSYSLSVLLLYFASLGFITVALVLALAPDISEGGASMRARATEGIDPLDFFGSSLNKEITGSDVNISLRIKSTLVDSRDNFILLFVSFTAILTAHGKTKACLHRFKIIESPECPCDGGNQTVDHLIYDCTKLQREREKLISRVTKQDNWPVNKSDLVNKHIKHFLQSANSIDFEKV
jgi:hypothetical protein